MKIKVYVANLGKYNEGILQGAWFTLPVTFEEISEAIGLNEEYEEYAIHDYEAPFAIHEYSSISELNEIAETLQGLSDDDAEALTALVKNGCIDKWDPSALQDVIWQHDCEDMGCVAYGYYEESGQLDAWKKAGFPVNYIDWDKIGRDMELEGTFIYLGNSRYIQYIG